jgi:hypothetical protein
MSSVRSTALLALAAAFLTVFACEDAERDPPPADPPGGATAGTGGAGGSPANPGAAPAPTGTGGRGGAAPGASGPGAGAPNVMPCPPGAMGTPCTTGAGIPPVCVQSSDGGLSGCICVQSTWMCGSVPGGS